MITVIELVFPASLRRHCVIHRLRNAAAKVSQTDQDAFKSDRWEVFNGIEQPPGELALEEARRRMDRFRAQWKRAYPAAVTCLSEDFENLTVHLLRQRSQGSQHERLRALVSRSFADCALAPTRASRVDLAQVGSFMPRMGETGGASGVRRVAWPEKHPARGKRE